MAAAAPKKVVIVGAGFGGLAAATGLHGLGACDMAEVHLIDQSDAFSIGGTWSYAMRGLCPLEATRLPLAQANIGATHLHANTTVEGLDLEARTLALSGGASLDFDYLVLATGTVSRPELVPGLAEHGLDLARFEHVSAVGQAVNEIAQAAQDAPKELLILVSETPYKCPPSPFEYAFIADDLMRQAGVRDNVTITVAIPVLWPFGGPQIEAAFKQKLADKGIIFRPDMIVTEVNTDNAGAKSAAFADGSSLPFDLLLCTTPQKAPAVLTQAGLTNPKGLVPVDLKTNRTKATDVFCVGDACMAMLPVVDKPHPKAGEFAAQMGQAVAETIFASLRAEELPLPTTRGAVCMAESGGVAGIGVNVSFDECMTDAGGPKYKVLIDEETGFDHKLGWVNGYVARFFGENLPPFAIEPAPAGPVAMAAAN